MGDMLTWLSLLSEVSGDVHTGVSRKFMTDIAHHGVVTQHGVHVVARGHLMVACHVVVGCMLVVGKYPCDQSNQQ